jgi:hypothetical protein
MNIELIEHDDTAWVRKVDIIHEGRRYRVLISWAMGEGYELLEGWEELPEAIRQQYDNRDDLVSELDEMTYSQAYNKEEANA